MQNFRAAVFYPKSKLTFPLTGDSSSKKVWPHYVLKLS